MNRVVYIGQFFSKQVLRTCQVPDTALGTKDAYMATTYPKELTLGKFSGPVWLEFTMFVREGGELSEQKPKEKSSDHILKDLVSHARVFYILCLMSKHA